MQPPTSPVALEMQRQQVEPPSPPGAASITPWLVRAFAYCTSQGCFSGLVARDGLLDYALAKFADLCALEPEGTVERAAEVERKAAAHARKAERLQALVRRETMGEPDDALV